MASPRLPIRSFLVQAKATLRTALKEGNKITLVIGNESADLDSLTSSLLYAYIRSSSPPSTAWTKLYIPVTNIPAKDIRLRPEFLALLPHANLEPEHLITLDDLPSASDLGQQLRPENTKWILVDHNALQGQLGKTYATRVAGVIDHHDEEDKVPRDTDPEPRIITKSGSCSSLVADYCRSAWDQLSASAMASQAGHAQGDEVVDDSAFTSVWDAQVARLALASILIDTADLQDKSKTTDHDIKAVEYLEAKIMASTQVAATFTREKFYEEIDTAKKDIESLALQDILRKDYKEWSDNETLGISSVVKPISFLVNKAGSEAKDADGNGGGAFLQSIKAFMDERNLDIYAIMTTSTSQQGNFQRELLVWAKGEQAVSSAQKFEHKSSAELKLEAWKGAVPDVQDKAEWRKTWQQSNVQHSRKRVAPLLREAMR